MSFVSDLFGSNSGGNFSATPANVLNPVSTAQTDAAHNNAVNSLVQQQAFLNSLQAQNGIGNQSSVFNQLQGVANGTGPNPAQAMLNQATGQNAANQSALINSQRGANANVGLIARQAAEAGSNAQQQSAGQAATLQAQQQLGALGNLGSLATSQVGQQQTAIGGLNQGNLGEQQLLLNSIDNQNKSNVANQSNVNNVNAGVAAQNSQAQGGLLGGLGSAISVFGGPIASGVSSVFGGNQDPSGNFGHGFAQGGQVQQPSELETILGDVAKMAPVALAMMKDGGKVPGQAAVKGDSPKNDTVSAKLSPGEIVIPRSILEHPNAPTLAAAFVEHVLNMHKASSKKNFDEGSDDGVVGGDAASVDDSEPTATQSSTQPIPDAAQNFVNQSIQDEPASQPAPASVDPATQATTSANTPTGVQGYDPTQILNKGVNQQNAGMNALTQVEGKEGKESADILQKQSDAADKSLAELKTNYANYDKQITSLMDDYGKQSINPNHYLGSMSTVGKISTAIGLILGGISSGVTHQGNPALEYLNKQIENDINAQKANLGKKETLLSMNLRHFGNLQEATMATNAMLTRKAAIDLQKVSAQNQGTVAGARAQMFGGQLLTQYSDQLQRGAMIKSYYQNAQAQQAQQQQQQASASRNPQSAAPANNADTTSSAQPASMLEGPSLGLGIPMSEGAQGALGSAIKNANYMFPGAQSGGSSSTNQAPKAAPNNAAPSTPSTPQNNITPPYADMSPDTRVVVHDPKQGDTLYHAANPKDAEEANDKLLAYRNLQDVLNRAQNFNKEKGYAFPKTGASGEAKAINKDAQIIISRSKLSSDAGLSRIANQFEDVADVAGGFFQAEQSGKLQALQDQLETEKQRFIQSKLLPGLTFPSRRK